MTHLSTTVSAKFLVDLINSYGGVLKAPAKKLISSFFHLFKFLLACSGLLSAGLKSYEKMFVKLLHNKSLSKYTEQIHIGYHSKQRKTYCRRKILMHIQGSYQYYEFPSRFQMEAPKTEQLGCIQPALCYIHLEQWTNSSANSFCKLGSPKQHQHLPVTASEHLGFLNMLMFVMLFKDTNNFAVMLMSGFWTTYICSLNYLIVKLIFLKVSNF